MKKCQVFVNFLTFKWQFSGGSAQNTQHTSSTENKDSPTDNATEDPATRFQTKYASPDNVLPPPQLPPSPLTTSEQNSNHISQHDDLLPPPPPPLESLSVAAPADVTVTQLSVSSVQAHTGVVAKANGNSVHSVQSGPAFSDTSSELSDSPFHMGFPSTNNKTVETFASTTESITDEDVNQVDIFYRSHKTDVRVCQSLANLYVSVPKIKDRASLNLSVSPNRDGEKPLKKKPSKKSKSGGDAPPEVQYAPPPRWPEPTDIKKDEWEFCKTGIPVLILDSGEHHRDRRLTLVLAERGTGFTLWSDVVNHLTKYSMPHDNFHTLTISTDSTRLVGLSFDDGPAALEFGEAMTSLMADPDDSLLNLSNKKKSKTKKDKKAKSKYKPPKKIDISQPCCFVHVTKLEKPDYLNIPQLVFPPPPSGLEVKVNKTDMLRPLSDSSGLSEGSTTPSCEH